MNLSLRTAGKDKCEDRDIDILRLLNDLMEHDNLQVRTYINGTLYSILVRPSLKAKARQMGMEEQLTFLMNYYEDPFKRQIQYILNQLYKETADDDQNSV
jgi:hypothetical protein